MATAPVARVAKPVAPAASLVPENTLDDLLGGVTSTAKTVTDRVQGKLPVNEAAARAAYAEADAFYRQAAAEGDSARRDTYRRASEKYQEAAAQWRDSSLEEDALFAAGDALFFAEDYPKANDAFEKLLKKYPNSRHLDQVETRRFRIAQWWLDETAKAPESFYDVNLADDTRPWRDTFGNAVRVFNKIRLEDPTGRLADDATLAAANAYFTKGEYEKADEMYDDLRQTFPNSEHQYLAHKLGLKSKLGSYRGPEYDGILLNEAEQLIVQMKRQFPREFEADREYLNRALAEVRFKQADRELRLAKYYDRRAEYGAAKYYYRLVYDKYGDTPLAAQAAQRGQELGNEPDLPAQQLEWLVKLFPEPEETRELIAAQPDGAVKR